MISVLALSICAVLLTASLVLLREAHSNSTKLLLSENERLRNLTEDLIRKMTVTPSTTISPSWSPAIEKELDPEPEIEGEYIDLNDDWDRLGLGHG